MCARMYSFSPFHWCIYWGKDPKLSKGTPSCFSVTWHMSRRIPQTAHKVCVGQCAHSITQNGRSLESVMGCRNDLGRRNKEMLPSDSMDPNLIVDRARVSEGTLPTLSGCKEDGRILYFQTCKIAVSITR